MEPMTPEQTALVLDNERLVYYIVNKNFPKFTEQQRDDYSSVGKVGLVKAARTFKPELGLKFATYASRVILNEIYMGLRKVKKHYLNSINMSAFTTEDPYEYSSPMELLDHSYGVTDDEPENNMRNEVVHHAIETAGFTKREMTIIQEYFFEGKKQRQLTDVASGEITQSYSSRLRARALEKLRRRLLELGEEEPYPTYDPGLTRKNYREALCEKKYQTSVYTQLKRPNSTPGGRKCLTDEELAERGLVRVRNENGHIWYKKTLQVWKENATEEELNAKGYTRRANGKVYKIQVFRPRTNNPFGARKLTDEELAERGQYRAPNGQIKNLSKNPKPRTFVERKEHAERRGKSPDYLKGYEAGFWAGRRGGSICPHCGKDTSQKEDVCQTTNDQPDV